MAVQFDTYDPQKIERLKTSLSLKAAKGERIPYEIFVDRLKAVSKTINPEEFDAYEDYLNPDTKYVKVVIYASEKAHRTEHYYFSLKATDVREALDEGLDGLPDKSYNTKELKALKEQRLQKTLDSEEVKQLKKQLEESASQNQQLHERMKEKENELLRLEKALETSLSQRNTLHGINLGQVLAEMGQAMLRKNTKIIAKIPGLEGIANAIDADTRHQAETLSQSNAESEEGEIEVNRKSDSGTNGLTEEEQHHLNFLSELKQHFTRDEFLILFEIINALTAQKHNLKVVQDLLRTKTSQFN